MTFSARSSEYGLSGLEIPIFTPDPSITGATSGIGKVAAEKLAAMGARMLVIARSRTRGEATLKRLSATAPEIDHRVYYADLSIVKEMKRVGDEIAAAESRIDVLINNAGALFGKREMTG